MQNMRLIDELLKDDFFHGGYSPAAAPAARGATPSGKKPIALIAGVAVAVLVLGGGAAYYFVLRPTAPAPAPAVNVQTAAVVPPQPAAAPAPATESAALAATTAETVAAAAPVTAAATPPPAAAAAEPEKLAPATEPDVEKFALVFPDMTDRKEVDRVLGELKKRGLKPKTVESKQKGEAYRVSAAKPLTEAEARALNLKAQIFKIALQTSTQADGTVAVDFGTFKTSDEARKAASAVQNLGLELKLSRVEVDVPVYRIETAGIAREEAETQVSELTMEGLDASMKKVK